MSAITKLPDGSYRAKVGQWFLVDLFQELTIGINPCIFKIHKGTIEKTLERVKDGMVFGELDSRKMHFPRPAPDFTIEPRNVCIRVTDIQVSSRNEVSPYTEEIEFSIVFVPVGPFKKMIQDLLDKEPERVYFGTRGTASGHFSDSESSIGNAWNSFAAFDLHYLTKSAEETAQQLRDVISNGPVSITDILAYITPRMRK